MNFKIIKSSIHSRVHGLDEQHFIFVVHSHDDEELRLAAHQVLAQRVPGGHEVVRVASGRSVPHLRHLLYILFPSGHNVRRHWDVEHQISLEELDLPD